MKFLVWIVNRTDSVFISDTISKSHLVMDDNSPGVYAYPNASRSAGKSKSLGRLLERRRNISRMVSAVLNLSSKQFAAIGKGDMVLCELPFAQ